MDHLPEPQTVTRTESQTDGSAAAAATTQVDPVVARQTGVIRPMLAPSAWVGPFRTVTTPPGSRKVQAASEDTEESTRTQAGTWWLVLQMEGPKPYSKDGKTTDESGRVRQLPDRYLDHGRFLDPTFVRRHDEVFDHDLLVPGLLDSHLEHTARVVREHLNPQGVA